ncbi:MAG TPA: hypothetical protein DEH78_11830, partial [Solibacterales bacterium]|nr:hypothetical protein [Bryobacterales bacterium]
MDLGSRPIGLHLPGGVRLFDAGRGRAHELRLGDPHRGAVRARRMARVAARGRTRGGLTSGSVGARHVCGPPARAEPSHAGRYNTRTLTLPDLFDLSLLGHRSEPALEWEGATYTFGEIDDRASRMAAALHGRGLRPGDRVAVYLPNSPDYIDLFLAATRLGVVFVPVNILYRDREIAHILTD